MRCLYMLVVAALLCGARGADDAAVNGQPPAAWTELGGAPDQQSNIAAIGVNADGTLWALTDVRTPKADITATMPAVYQKPCWWDGERWHEVPAPDGATVKFFRGLYGGGACGLYAAARSDHEKRADLYLLADGKATRVTDFTCSSHLQPPALGVSSTGVIITVDPYGVELYADGERKQLDVRVGTAAVSFFENAEGVHFFAGNALGTVSADGTVVTHELDGIETEGRGPILGYAWGDDRLLVITSPAKPFMAPSDLYAFSTKTGKPIDATDLADVLEGHHVCDAFGGPDGTVWLYTTNPRVVPTVYTFKVLTPEGDLFEIEETKKLDWGNNRSRFFPQSMLAASDGTIWLGLYKEGVVSYKDGTFTRYGADAGFPFGFRCLAEGTDGTIYAATSNKVFARKSNRGHKDE